MLTHSEAEARVAKGAAFLDEHWPDWARHVDVLTLDMTDGCRCVLGQLEGDYNEACPRIWPARMRPARLFDVLMNAIEERLVRLLGVLMNAIEERLDSFCQAEALGFDAPPPPTAFRTRWFTRVERADYQLLQDAWVTQIAQRRVMAEGASPALATGDAGTSLAVKLLV